MEVKIKQLALLIWEKQRHKSINLFELMRVVSPSSPIKL